MTGLLDIVGWVLMAGALFFVLTAAIGLLRMPDLFTRMHAAGLTDTMGAALVLLALATQTDDLLILFRLLLVLVLIWFTSPIAGYALSRSALHGGLDPAFGVRRRGDEGGAPS